MQALRDSIIDLYLAVKIRSNEEVSQNYIYYPIASTACPY